MALRFTGLTVPMRCGPIPLARFKRKADEPRNWFHGCRVRAAAALLAACIDCPALILPVARQRLWLAINHMLMMAREAVGLEASPSTGVIDSQSVKTTESGGPCGYEAGKKIKGAIGTS